MADAGLDAHDFSAFSSIDGSTEFPARELTFMTLSSYAALSFASRSSINLSNGLLLAYCLKRLAYRERGNTTCNFPLWSVALANTGSTSKGSSTIRITLLF